MKTSISYNPIGEVSFWLFSSSICIIVRIGVEYLIYYKLSFGGTWLNKILNHMALKLIFSKSVYGSQNNI